MYEKFYRLQFYWHGSRPLLHLSNLESTYWLPLHFTMLIKHNCHKPPKFLLCVCKKHTTCNVKIHKLVLFIFVYKYLSEFVLMINVEINTITLWLSYNLQVVIQSPNCLTPHKYVTLWLNTGIFPCLMTEHVVAPTYKGVQ